MLVVPKSEILESATDRIIQDLDAEPGGPGRLGRFLTLAFRGRRRLDRAMRAWGAEDPQVAAIVAREPDRLVVVTVYAFYFTQPERPP